jgi:hypothetical protein
MSSQQDFFDNIMNEVDDMNLAQKINYFKQQKMIDENGEFTQLMKDYLASEVMDLPAISIIIQEGDQDIAFTTKAINTSVAGGIAPRDLLDLALTTRQSETVKVIQKIIREGGHQDLSEREKLRAVHGVMIGPGGERTDVMGTYYV